MIVTIQHLHACPAWNGKAGLCSRGARAWCAQHNIDWQDFVANGIDSAVLLATGDALAQQVVDFALEADRG